MQDDILTKELRDIIVHTLEEHKAEDIVVIDLKNKSDIADFMIVATGRSTKHVSSTADFIMEKVKARGNPYIVEGMGNSEWVLIDTLDIITHLFTKEKRDLYALEKLWQK